MKLGVTPGWLGSRKRTAHMSRSCSGAVRPATRSCGSRESDVPAITATYRDPSRAAGCRGQAAAFVREAEHGHLLAAQALSRPLDAAEPIGYTRPATYRPGDPRSHPQDVASQSFSGDRHASRASSASWASMSPSPRSRSTGTVHASRLRLPGGLSSPTTPRSWCRWTSSRCQRFASMCCSY